MATICFRPPPLPPSKKSTSSNGSNNSATNANRNRIKQNHSLLSSTYLSFRDPAEDEILPAPEEIELTSFKCNKNNKRCRRVSHTNSLRRCNKEGRTTMSRSHSDGNLDKKAVSGSQSHMGINRYMKVLSGSWRNLLNRKLVAIRCFSPLS